MTALPDRSWQERPLTTTVTSLANAGSRAGLHATTRLRAAGGLRAGITVEDRAASRGKAIGTLLDGRTPVRD